MKTLVAITGPDGAGKDTLIQSLLRPGVRAVTIWDSLMDPEFRKAFPILPEKIDSYLKVLTSPARALFLAHAIRQSLERAFKDSSSHTLILNGYWMKYFACEVAYGSTSESMLALAELLPLPKKILYLDLPVEVALSRKSKLSGFETGFAEPELRRDRFVSFQSQVHSVLHSWQKQSGWIRIDATQAPEEVLKRTREELNEFIS